MKWMFLLIKNLICLDYDFLHLFNLLYYIPCLLFFPTLLKMLELD